METLVGISAWPRRPRLPARSPAPPASAPKVRPAVLRPGRVAARSGGVTRSEPVLAVDSLPENRTLNLNWPEEVDMRMIRTISKDQATERGFTLMELMVVIVIIGILVTIVGGRLITNVDEARRLQAKTKVDKVKEAILRYKLRRMELPNALEDLLEEDERNFGDPYLEDEDDLLDPWGEPLEYKIEGRKIEIISYGADKAPGGDGYDADVSSARSLDKFDDN